MAFSVLATLGVALMIAVLLMLGMAPVLLIPVLLVLGVTTVAVWLAWGWLRGARVANGPASSGVPSTAEASYDPVQRPQ
jgi:hypothetical protein